MRSVKSFAVAFVLLAAGAALACKCIEFKNATAIMATPTIGSAYVTFVSDKDDTLIGLSSPCCDAVELHSSTMKDGVMSMRRIEKLDLTSGVAVTLAEHNMQGDSMHLMLIGLHKEYKPGQKFPIAFTFAKEGKHEAIFTVAKRGTH